MPADPRPYVFLAKAYDISTAEAKGVTERLQRFTRLFPNDAQAWYWYALSVWKGERNRNPESRHSEVELLFQKAISLEVHFADAHFQLGNLYVEEGKLDDAISEYLQTIKLQPTQSDAHYRLAQAYVRTGRKTEAQKELGIYDNLHKKDLSKQEKIITEINQFVYTLQDNERSSSLPPKP